MNSKVTLNGVTYRSTAYLPLFAAGAIGTNWSIQHFGPGLVRHVPRSLVWAAFAGLAALTFSKAPPEDKDS